MVTSKSSKEISLESKSSVIFVYRSFDFIKACRVV
jgi:hypothetical protein